MHVIAGDVGSQSGLVQASPVAIATPNNSVQNVGIAIDEC